MPIHCALTIDSLSTNEFAALDYAVMAQMFAAQNTIGRLADERVYKADVVQRLRSVGISSHVEVPIKLSHETFAKELSIDLLVSQRAAYEVKTVSGLNSSHEAQLLTYLYLLDLPHGKLVNFRSPAVESRFVNAPIPREERCGFSVSEDGFRGDRELLALVVALIRDWGTCLSVSLYHQAIVHLLGGREAVQCMLPLTRNGQTLANQHFHVLDNDNAFELTAFAKPENDHHGQLQRLLDLSPLRAMQWINVGPHDITLRTVERA